MRVARSRDRAELQVESAIVRAAIDGPEHRLIIAARQPARDLEAVIGVAARDTEPPHTAPSRADRRVGADDEAARVARELRGIVVATRRTPITKTLAPKAQEMRLIHAHLDGRELRPLAGWQIGRIGAGHGGGGTEDRRIPRPAQPVEDGVARQ